MSSRPRSSTSSLKSQRFATVILSFNHPQITESCVQSCLANCKSDDLFLIHNGSTEKHIQYLKNQFPEIQHRVLPRNIGFSGGANYGLKEVTNLQKHEWIFFVTNDCEILETGITPSSPGLYAPKILKRNTGKIDSLGGFVEISKGQLTHNREPKKMNYVPGTAFLIHCELIKNKYLFNEALGTYWEDVELSLRVLNSSFTMGLADSFVLKHRIGKTCHKSQHYTTYLYQRNRGIVCRHYSRGLSRLSFELIYFFDIAKRLFKFLVRRKTMQAFLIGKAYIRSWVDHSGFKRHMKPMTYSTTLSAAETAS